MADNYMEGYGIKISEIIDHLSYDKILPYIAKDLNRDPEELKLAARERWCDDGESLVSMYESDTFVGKVIADIANRKDSRMVLDITKDAKHDVYCVTYPEMETYYPWDRERKQPRRSFISKEEFEKTLKEAVREICDETVEPVVSDRKIWNFG